ncbi:MAG: hypothetical protein CVU00_06145 [Bacteroidetes bacterium HGW-Bacteroidetes-17]|nr:MAG: hypothetical protein CVU00_06145 [Bacteroidetes bacterium HGW-Bacteroidetes-17]
MSIPILQIVISNPEPSMDWNWFFSTISQSASAFIAIVFAYIVFQWGKFSSEMADEFKEFDELLLLYRKLQNTFNSDAMKSFNIDTLFMSQTFYKLLKDQEFNKSDDQKISKKLQESFIQIPRQKSLFLIYDGYRKAFYKGANFAKIDNFEAELLKFERRYQLENDNKTRYQKIIESFKNEQIGLFNVYDRFKSLKSKTKLLVNNINFVRNLLIVLSFGSFVLIILPLLFLPYYIGDNTFSIIYNFSTISIWKSAFILLFMAFFFIFNTILFKSIKNQRSKILGLNSMLKTNKYEDKVLSMWPHEFFPNDGPEGGYRYMPTFRF